MKRRQVQVILATALVGLFGLTACGVAVSGDAVRISRQPFLHQAISA